jgi:spermidine synthase
VNTVGAILGSVASGFVLLHFFGIERSLHMLVVVNVAAGLAVAASVTAPRWVVAAVSAVAGLLLVGRGVYPEWGRAWDQKFFATWTNNVRTLDPPEIVKRKLEHVDVLYYFEGVNETVSVIRPRGSVQTYIVNGRAEASTAVTDVQVQKSLGHVPMLLHKNPRSAFVLGTGTGMTLGAVAVHPGLERLVLGEIEVGMLGVARTFERWNNRALDSPKLEIVLNDGRNFLATTRELFDVISADPIHPWSGGAGYLYTREYFRSVADRLAPGGVACQWLPLYELTVHDVRTVVRTFSETFPHVLVWLSSTDATLVGSKEPFVIDEAELARRLEVPAIRDDLAPLYMSTAEGFLSFFLMGTAGARAFGEGGSVNTDDNLLLEFSAPASQGIAGLDATNVRALAHSRESLLPYLRRPASEAEAAAQRERWTRHLETGRIFDEAQARFLLFDPTLPEVDTLLDLVEASDPSYAPLRFVRDEQAFWERMKPALVDEVAFDVRDAGGAPAALRLSAVRQFLGRERVLVSFVDTDRRKIYAQRFVDGDYKRLELDVIAHVGKTFAGLRAVAARVPVAPGAGVPAEDHMERALRDALAGQVARDPSL